jgi:hypothetical protein
MKMRKLVFLAVCVALGAALVACGSSGGGGGRLDFGAGTPATGDWVLELDQQEGGVSTGTLTTTTMDGKEAYHIAGHIPAQGTGIEWPWAQLVLECDDDTIETFKGAKGVSFMAKGNGGQYDIRIEIESVTDWAWHTYTFTAPATATRIQVPMSHFMQPSWGAFKRFDLSRFTGIQIAPVGYGINYDITISDLQIH